ncbi:hypothetical protein CC86DRAFT_368492 [Ophiobolus disseminans]|uniref:SnoaL-like domain-containing protein n=1 Tax=Ophiobolus disseminans TaxID=1469910 RepID=A0A6A7A8G8_9PLEO|nr:hypothetical protein CC86DRAFT_368492 [Ophiobolus disseminans]
MSPTSSDLQQIAGAFLHAFKDLSAKGHIALRAPACMQIFAPSSLNPPSPKSNDVFGAHIENNVRPVMDHFPVTAKEIHVNETGRQVTIRANGKPGFKEEAIGDSSREEWDYTGEYIFILDVDEDGKIVRVL